MNNKFPIQKVSATGKTKQWFIDSVIYGVDMAMNENNAIKPDNKTIIENLKLYNGDRDAEEIKKNFDSVGLVGAKYSPSFRNFSTIRDRIDELVGEYIEKGVDYVIAAIDRDAINTKIEENRERLRKVIEGLIHSKEIQDPEKIKEALERAVNFKYMSKAEVAANKLLTFYKKSLGLVYKEIEGFRNALITAVVGFSVEIVNGKLEVQLPSPETIYAVRNGYSNDLKESELIAIVDYLPKSKLIDKYRDDLSDSDIKKILKEDLGSAGFTAALNAKQELVFNTPEDLERFTKSAFSDKSNTAVMDSYGNIREVKLRWTGYRKVYKRKFFDKNGEVQYDYKSEFYKADVASGEELTVRWIPENYEGVLIGGDLVVKAKVCDYQFNSVTNISKNISGFVGGYFNVGNEKAKSLVDYTKSYSYLRDSIFARIEDLMAKNIGKVIELDLAKKPQSWSVKKVLYFLKRYGIQVVDSFNEGTKGRSMGKLVGQYNQGTRVMDAELGTSIGYMIELLNLVDSMIARSTGVTDQRLGAINTRELVGNVERSRVQSSLITEIWFNRYEQIILDLYATIIEIGKMTVGEDERLQFVLDDTSYAMITEGLKELKLTKLGLFPINSAKYNKLKSVLESLAIQSIPNGNMDVESLIALYDSNSMAEMIDKQYEISDRNKKLRAEIEKMKNEARTQEIEAAKKYEVYMKELDNKFNMGLEKLRGDYKVLIEQMKLKDGAIADHIKALSELNADEMKYAIENAKIKAMANRDNKTVE